MIFYLTIIDIEVHKFLFLKRAMKTFASNLPRQAFLGKRGQEQNPNVTILQEKINKLIRENQLQAVKHESNKHNKQDHGGLPITL